MTNTRTSIHLLLLALEELFLWPVFSASSDWEVLEGHVLAHRWRGYLGVLSPQPLPPHIHFVIQPAAVREPSSESNKTLGVPSLLRRVTKPLLVFWSRCRPLLSSSKPVVQITHRSKDQKNKWHVKAQIDSPSGRKKDWLILPLMILNLFLTGDGQTIHLIFNWSFNITALELWSASLASKLSLMSIGSPISSSTFAVAPRSAAGLFRWQ